MAEGPVDCICGILASMRPCTPNPRQTNSHPWFDSGACFLSFKGSYAMVIVACGADIHPIHHKGDSSKTGQLGALAIDL